MTKANSLLDEEEIDFLLTRANAKTVDEMFDPSTDDGANVTIRGDLENISLGDIFQTLSTSKMRGILRVFNPLETRLIYFENGTVRLMNANRKGTRRIGQRLVRSGALTTAQLRQALLEQKVTDAPLGETLIDLGYLTEQELNAVLNNQLEEDLHNIFVWGSGSFEFYKNKPDSEEVLAEMGRTPGFEVNGLLLEAARRRDEWSQILESIGSVHAIPVIPADVEFPEMSGNLLVVCEAVDNFSTISDLAETTMLGLFTCSKAICELRQDGLIALANPDLTIELALDATHKQDTKRALQLCQNLRHHAAELDFELCEKLATVLESCREPRLSANILLECAKNLETVDHRLGIAQRALGVDRHAIPVMEFIRHEMRVAQRTTAPEYADNLARLCESMSAEGNDEQALEVFKELEQMSLDRAGLAGKKARLLQRAGRDEEALECLLELRSEQEKNGERKDLVRTYEQILKLDPTQKDVAKALRTLRIGKTKVRLHRLYATVATTLVLGGSYFAWSWSETRKHVERATTEIRSHLESRDLNKARSTLAHYETLLGEQAIWLQLRDEISVTSNRIQAEEKAKIEKGHIKTLNVVSDLLQKGSLEAALAQYQTLLKQSTAIGLVRRIAPGQLHRLTKRLESLLDRLRDKLPDAPNPLLPHEALVAALARLEDKIKIDTELARSVLVIAEHGTVKELWPNEDLTHARSVALEVQAVAQTVASRTNAYRAIVNKNEKRQRLDPVFQAAKRAEEQRDFQTAEKLYRQLLDEFSSNRSLAPGFRDRVQKYSEINLHLQKLTKATADGQFREARAFFLHLKRTYTEFPWSSMVHLPLRITTTPPGAAIALNGKDQGRSPLTLRYRPSDDNVVQIEMAGFATQKIPVTDEVAGHMDPILDRTPAWSFETKGAIDRSAVATQHHRIFVVDRTGTVTAMSAKERKPLWHFRTGDLSGLLTRPVLYKDQLIVGSLDGTLRGLDQASGTVQWSLPGLPCESRPVIARDKLVLASDSNLVVIDLKKAKKPIIRRTPLTSAVRQDLLVIDQSVLVTQDNGTVRLLSMEKGTDHWTPIQLGGGLVSQPLRVGQTLILATDEGSLSAYRLAAGTRIWHRIGLGELQWRPTSDGKQVFVLAQPTPDAPATIHSFSITTGVPGRRYTAPAGEFWSTHPALLRGRLIAGSRSGLFRVLDTQTMQLLYHIRGQGAASARPVSSATGTTLFSFENKQTLVFQGMR